jgi:hypothetical protein
MNTEKQRIAIAEACGWTDVKGTKGVHPKARFKGCGYADDWIALPDYLTDLNAMHEVENTLSVRDKQGYISILRNICTVAGCWPETATAAQRARAFLETLGLWEDDK